MTAGSTTGGRGGRPGAAPRRPAATVVACLLLLAGCRGADRRYDLLESELRTRERELLQARAEANQLRFANQTYQRQAPPVYPPGADPSAAGFGGGGPPVAVPVRDITLGAGTGGVDEDRQPGDESLMVVVVPRDEDGSPVKVAARAAVSAFDITPAGIKTPIGRWEVPPDQLRKTWRNGLLGNGYFVPLQWDQLPATGRVRVVARLTTADGRDYEAEKDVTVRPLAGAGRPPGLGPPAAAPELPPPTRAPELPPPSVPELPPPTAVR